MRQVLALLPEGGPETGKDPHNPSAYSRRPSIENHRDNRIVDSFCFISQMMIIVNYRYRSYKQLSLMAYLEDEDRCDNVTPGMTYFGRAWAIETLSMGKYRSNRISLTRDDYDGLLDRIVRAIDLLRFKVGISIGLILRSGMQRGRYG